jgi:hypothetical protein
MRVYVLHFENLGRLTRAFDRVLEHDDVESSMIEPDGMRLRFLGPRELTERLVEPAYYSTGRARGGRPLALRERVVAALTRADADRILDGDHGDLAVADLARTGRLA